MNSEQFESKARLFVLGALDDDELVEFEAARHDFGPEGEHVIRECERLSSMFALSLRPTAPKPATKERLLSMIEQALGRGKNAASETEASGR